MMCIPPLVVCFFEVQQWSKFGSLASVMNFGCKVSMVLVGMKMRDSSEALELYRGWSPGF